MHSPGSPVRIADEIVAVLAAMPCVSAIALFGSLADGSADAWSDVDMLVACDDVEVAKWAVAAAIREAKPVLFYRPFSTAQQPSGRYWFVGESPFRKLDISFDSLEDYTGILNGGGRLGHPISALEVHRSVRKRAPSPFSDAYPLVIGEREAEIGDYIYQSLRSLKRCYRGGEESKGFAELRTVASGLSPDVRMAGGRIGELLHAIARIVDITQEGTAEVAEGEVLGNSQV